MPRQPLPPEQERLVPYVAAGIVGVFALLVLIGSLGGPSERPAAADTTVQRSCHAWWRVINEGGHIGGVAAGWRSPDAEVDRYTRILVIYFSPKEYPLANISNTEATDTMEKFTALCRARGLYR
jgi:hypothetical protein